MGDGGDILAINQDMAALNIVQAQDQLHQGGFSRTRWPDETDALLRLDVDIEVFEHRPRGVGEGDVVEFDRRCGHDHSWGIRVVGDFVSVDDGLHALLHLSEPFEETGVDLGEPESG